MLSAPSPAPFSFGLAAPLAVARGPPQEPLTCSPALLAQVFGECPVLMGRMAVAVVHGLQGRHPFRLTAAATCKHLAAHSLEVMPCLR